MGNDSFESYVRGISQKFDYAFVALSFASLALSVQFSPNMGMRMAWCLVLSWLFLLVSGILGGWRLMKQPIFYRLNLHRNQIKESIENRRLNFINPGFNASLEMGQVFDGTTGKSLSRETLQAQLKKKYALLELAEKNLKELEPQFPRLFSLQLWAFLIGIALNSLFTATNYLSKVYGG